MEARFRSLTAVEYFKELVETAVEHQGLQTDESTSYYVVNLLAACVKMSERPGEGIALGEPLGLHLIRALHEPDARQRQSLRRVGDASLFVAGFFSDSLKRRLVDIDYYATLGTRAYGALGQGDHVLAPIFAELAEKFVAFVDLLTEISGRTGLTSNSDVLRLYERWLRTGSRQAGTLLAERGIVPSESATSKYVQ